MSFQLNDSQRCIAKIINDATGINITVKSSDIKMIQQAFPDISKALLMPGALPSSPLLRSGDYCLKRKGSSRSSRIASSPPRVRMSSRC